MSIQSFITSQSDQIHPLSQTATSVTAGMVAATAETFDWGGKVGAQKPELSRAEAPPHFSILRTKRRAKYFRDFPASENQNHDVVSQNCLPLVHRGDKNPLPLGYVYDFIPLQWFQIMRIYWPKEHETEVKKAYHLFKTMEGTGTRQVFESETKGEDDVTWKSINKQLRLLLLQTRTLFFWRVDAPLARSEKYKSECGKHDHSL